MNAIKNLTAIQIAAIVGLILTPLGSAWNVTIEELADQCDRNPATILNWEVLIKAWGDVLQAAFIAILASFRSKDYKP